jgi:hypothetical protein
MVGPQASQTATPAAPSAATPADPLVAFAATAAPGARGNITAPDTGRATPVRLTRAYNAASGRECREVLLGAGAEERARLVCATEGGWAAARPLLQGGAGRP